jgi:hypothetical protein
MPQQAGEETVMVDTRTRGSEAEAPANGATARRTGGSERATRRSLARIGGVAALAVRQIEVALTSVFTLALGCTLCVFALAMLFSRRYPAWLGATGILGGLATVAIWLEQASGGFSPLSLNLFMVVGPVDLAWVCITGVLMWRLAPRLAGAGPRHTDLGGSS